MERFLWYGFIGLTLAMLALSTCSQKEMAQTQSKVAESQIAQLKEISERLKPIESVNDSIKSIADDLKAMSLPPGVKQESGIKDRLKEQLAGMGLSAEQVNALIDDVLKEFRAQLESGSGDVRRDIGDQILGRAVPKVPPPQLIEKAKPLWEAAVRKAVEAATLPRNFKSAVADRLIKYADKAVETLISELIKSGLAWAKGVLSPDKEREPHKIEVNVTCPGTCPAPPQPGPPRESSSQPASFIVPFRSRSFSVKEQNQVQQLWRARNHYQEHLTARPGREGYGLILRGYTDTTGDERLNRRLRLARTRSVTCELIRLGVPRAALQADSSQTKIPVPVVGKVAIPQNRTVIIEEGLLSAGEPLPSC